MCFGSRSASNGAYNVAYSVRGDTITFALQAMTTGWVGIGFSLDQLMVSHLCMQTNLDIQNALHVDMPPLLLPLTVTCSPIQMWLLVLAVLKVHLCMTGESVAETINTLQQWSMVNVCSAHAEHTHVQHLPQVHWKLSIKSSS